MSTFLYSMGGGQGCHFEAAFGMSLLKSMGSRYNYNALAQELTGYFWACGRMTGRQNRFSYLNEKTRLEQGEVGMSPCNEPWGCDQFGDERW